MDIKQISDTLNRIFTEKNKRIIFWYDGEREFDEILPSLELNDAAILRMDAHSALELKIKLEIDDPVGKYVLYAPWHEQPPEDDWLFDIRLYSYTFLADTASITLKELDLNHQSIRPYIRTRKAFFNSQDRMNRLKKWVAADDLEDEIDLKMLAVITRADQPEPFSILMKLFDSFCHKGKFDIQETSKPWMEIEKLDLMPFFWKILSQTFGYVNTDTPSLIDFLLRVFVTDFANSIKADPPSSISNFIIPNPTQAMNSSVFLSQWRSNTNHFKNYNAISQFAESRLKINELLSSIDASTLDEIMTFEAVERRIISGIRDQLIGNSENGYPEMREAIKHRLDGHWATTTLEEDFSGNRYRITYHAMLSAIDLFELRRKYDAGFSYPSAEAMLAAYTRELFLFDQLYRNRRLSFKPKGDIVVDDKATGSTALRADILSLYEGTAIKADELMVMSKDKGREFVKPYRIIYIFHDQIDATGDKAVSEGNTFEAVRKTIDDLYALISFIINSLNGTNVIVTADHGFIYQEKPPEPMDKSNIEFNPENAVKTNKRFILGKKLNGADNAFFGNTKITAHTDVEMEFLLPKGTNRLNFVGGARFYHGGAMLQEIVIPVVSVSEMKGIHLEKSEVRSVGVSLLGAYKKLVTNRPVYKFIQTDQVSDRMKALTLKISLRDGNDLISNEETVTFDSASASLDERQKSVKLSLKSGTYDNKKEYFLVLRNMDETEYERMPLNIDIAFTNDF